MNENLSNSITVKSNLVEISDMFINIKGNIPSVESITVNENVIVISMGDKGNYVVKTDSISYNEILEKLFSGN